MLKKPDVLFTLPESKRGFRTHYINPITPSTICLLLEYLQQDRTLPFEPDTFAYKLHKVMSIELNAIKHNHSEEAKCPYIFLYPRGRSYEGGYFNDVYIKRLTVAELQTLSEETVLTFPKINEADIHLSQNMVSEMYNGKLVIVTCVTDEDLDKISLKSIHDLQLTTTLNSRNFEYLNNSEKEKSAQIENLTGHVDYLANELDKIRVTLNKIMHTSHTHADMHISGHNPSLGAGPGLFSPGHGAGGVVPPMGGGGRWATSRMSTGFGKFNGNSNEFNPDIFLGYLEEMWTNIITIAQKDNVNYTKLIINLEKRYDDYSHEEYKAIPQLHDPYTTVVCVISPTGIKLYTMENGEVIVVSRIFGHNHLKFLDTRDPNQTGEFIRLIDKHLMKYLAKSHRTCNVMEGTACWEIELM